MDGLEPLWVALSASHRRCGEDPGTAATLKIVANYLLLSGLAALAEAVATAQGAGIDAESFRGFLPTLPLVAPGLHNRLDDVIEGITRAGSRPVWGPKTPSSWTIWPPRPGCGSPWPAWWRCATGPWSPPAWATPTSGP